LRQRAAARGAPAAVPRRPDLHRAARTRRAGGSACGSRHGRAARGRAMIGPNRVVPLRFDLSDLVRRSVASLYSHLVTRPTGQALRIGIESQIAELGAICVSILDFTQVIVLDYSCADETVAKLLMRYQQPDRPAE